MLLSKKEAWVCISVPENCYVWRMLQGNGKDDFYIAGPKNISAVSTALYEYWLEENLIDPESFLWFTEEQINKNVVWHKNFIESLQHPGYIEESIFGTIPVWSICL